MENYEIKKLETKSTTC